MVSFSIPSNVFDSSVISLPILLKKFDWSFAEICGRSVQIHSSKILSQICGLFLPSYGSIWST